VKQIIGKSDLVPHDRMVREMDDGNLPFFQQTFKACLIHLGFPPASNSYSCYPQ
jgi:hypothetical protein